MDEDSPHDIKLVRYKVLFVRRGYEVAFPQEEELVGGELERSAFAASKLTEFLQDLANKPSHVRFPEKWIEQRYAQQHNDNGYLNGIPAEDLKYLRVYCEVLNRAGGPLKGPLGD